MNDKNGKKIQKGSRFSFAGNTYYLDRKKGYGTETDYPKTKYPSEKYVLINEQRDRESDMVVTEKKLQDMDRLPCNKRGKK